MYNLQHLRKASRPLLQVDSADLCNKAKEFDFLTKTRQLSYCFAGITDYQIKFRFKSILSKFKRLYVLQRCCALILGVKKRGSQHRFEHL